MPTIRPATTADLDRIVALLQANDLPHRDVRAKPECFVVARDETGVVGAAGVERHGSDGLLRSLVVAASARGQGYGTALCDDLEARSRADGVETLYALTTTAAPFLRRRGYEEVPRTAAPPGIRGTAEFTDLCPASATCLAKPLE